MTRATTWSNSDGLVVGFGKNFPERAGNVHEANAGSPAGVKSASVYLTYKEMNLSTTGGTVNVPVPLGAKILNVRFVCHTAWTCTGTNTFELGLTGGDVDLFLTTTVGTIANMTAGAVLNGDGVGTYDDTGDGDVTAAELYHFTAADTIDLVTAQSDWLTGTGSIVVTYI